jgi:hypothetical protein
VTTESPSQLTSTSRRRYHAAARQHPRCTNDRAVIVGSTVERQIQRRTPFERLDAVADRRVGDDRSASAKRNSGQGLPITVEHDRFARQRH